MAESFTNLTKDINLELRSSEIPKQDKHNKIHSWIHYNLTGKN